MNNPIQQVTNAALAAQIAGVPPAVRAAIVAAAGADARSVLPVPYWSTVRLAGVVAASVLTIDTTQRKAFQYAVGQDMQIAGFTAGTVAQNADTNLLRAGETLDNADVWMWGLAAELCPNSDPAVAARLWRECDVQLSLNGTTSIRLGTLSMFPSAGGLYGQGQSALLLPPEPSSGLIDGGPGASFGAMANGNPMAGNFLKFPQPFKWGAVGKGGADAQLSIIVTPNRTITMPVPAARAAAAGTTGAYTPPTTGQAGTFADIRFRLVSVSVSDRSVNF